MAKPHTNSHIFYDSIARTRPGGLLLEASLILEKSGKPELSQEILHTGLPQSWVDELRIVGDYLRVYKTTQLNEEIRAIQQVAANSLPAQTTEELSLLFKQLSACSDVEKYFVAVDKIHSFCRQKLSNNKKIDQYIIQCLANFKAVRARSLTPSRPTKEIKQIINNIPLRHSQKLYSGLNSLNKALNAPESIGGAGLMIERLKAYKTFIFNSLKSDDRDIQKTLSVVEEKLQGPYLLAIQTPCLPEKACSDLT